MDFAKLNKTYQLLSTDDNDRDQYDAVEGRFDNLLKAYTSDEYVTTKTTEETQENYDKRVNTHQARLYHLAVLEIGVDKVKLNKDAFLTFKIPDDKHLKGEGVVVDKRQDNNDLCTDIQEEIKKYNIFIEANPDNIKNTLSAFACYPGALNKMPALIGPDVNAESKCFNLKAINQAIEGMYITQKGFEGAFSDLQLLNEINTEGKDKNIVVMLDAHGGYKKDNKEFSMCLYKKDNLNAWKQKDGIYYEVRKFQKVLENVTDKDHKIILDVYSCHGRGMTKDVQFSSNVTQIFHTSSKYTTSSSISKSEEVTKNMLKVENKDWSNEQRMLSLILENIAHARPLTIVINDLEQIEEIKKLTNFNNSLSLIEDSKDKSKSQGAIRIKSEEESLVIKLSPNLLDVYSNEENALLSPTKTEKILNERLQSLKQILKNVGFNDADITNVNTSIDSKKVEQLQREIVAQEIGRIIKNNQICKGTMKILSNYQN